MAAGTVVKQPQLQAASCKLQGKARLLEACGLKLVAKLSERE
jgi:hypothetical protein